jgi:hypothetical protein
MWKLHMTNRRKSEIRDSKPEEPVWKSEPGEPPIKGPGDLLAMMAQGGHELAESDSADDQTEQRNAPDSPGQQGELRNDERAAEGLPPRKAIISIDGKDVEEREIQPGPRKRRVA